MNFKCSLKKLREAVNSVSLCVMARSTIPALEGILIQCENQKILLQGYDMEMGIQKQLEVQMKEEGAIVLNAQLFGEILKKMDDEMIEIITNEKLMTYIKGNTAEFHILGIEEKEYPNLPKMEEQKSFEISDLKLKSMIERTLFSASVSTQTPILNGALFSIENEKIEIVAVDGYRVAIARNKLDMNKNQNFIFVVPSKALNEAVKLLSEDKDKTVTISIGNKHVMFSIHGYYLITRLLEGEFIDYKNALLKQTQTTIKVNSQKILQSVERVSVMINMKNKMPIQMEMKEQTIYLNCESTIGKVSDHLSVQMQGNPLKIAYNNRYMIDALRHAGNEELMIEFKDELSPISIKPTEGDAYQFLILPVRMKSYE